MTAVDHNEELESLLEVWAAVRGWLGRALTFGRRAVGGRFVVAAAMALTLLVLICFERPPVPEVPKTKVVISQAVDVESGQPVSRPEWIDRALAASTN